jgi:hypothetical protein
MSVAGRWKEVSPVRALIEVCGVGRYYYRTRGAELELERKQRDERRQGLSDEHHAKQGRELAELFAKRYWDFCALIDVIRALANPHIRNRCVRGITARLAR